MTTHISVIVPSKGCIYLKYLFQGLRRQNIRPSEVILVLKGCNIESVEELCRFYNLPCTVIEQKKGYFTHALNIGKKEAKRDIIVFTDDDAIPLKKWLQRYIEIHKLYSKAAGICSRDIYLDLKNVKLLLTPDDKPTVMMYRWFIRPWLEQAHLLLGKYKLGVYITRRYDIAHGPYIPYRKCYSLPLRGVNMSFKAEYTYDVWFPEHPLLKRALGNEQYFGLQLILKGLDTIYIPNNPILHIFHESLSRLANKNDLKQETEIMKILTRRLLERARL